MWPMFVSLCLVLSGKSARKAPPRRRPAFRRPQHTRPRLMILEDRLAPATLTVNTTADNTYHNDVGYPYLTLRDAILLVNDPSLTSDLTAAQQAQISGTLDVPGVPDVIDFALPWNDSGHVYYQGSMGNVQPVPSGTSSDADLIGTAAPQWQHSWWSIQPQSALPTIASPVLIDGYTQPGAEANTLAVGDNAVLKISLQSDSMSVYGSSGLELVGGDTTVRGLVIGGFDNAIFVLSSNNLIEGDFLGTDVTGTQVNANQYGVAVQGSAGSPANGNRIGTSGLGASDFADRNIISGNGVGAPHAWGDSGVYLQSYASYNLVAGNYIGTDASGTQALGNSDFGLIMYAPNGPAGNNDIEGNVISANVYDGVGVSGAESHDTITGNRIGTDVTGTQNLGNGRYGVFVLIGAQGVSVSGNVIAYNVDAGVEASQAVVNGPGFGPTDGVRIEGNSIHDNGSLGIILGGTFDWALPLGLDTPLPGVLPNDSQGHSGPNDFQNFPVLSSAVSSSTDTSITGTFSEAAEPNTTLTLDFYANPSADPSGYGQGQTWLGSTTVTTDANGNVAFTADLAAGNLAGQWITATATDPGGNTSEFGLDVQATTAASLSYAQYLQAALPQSPTTADSMTIQASASVTPATVIGAVNSLVNVTQPVTVILDLGGGTYSSGGASADPPANVTFVVQNGTLDPSYPALTVSGGQVSVRHCTLTTSGNAPTVLVTGGTVTLRDDNIIQASTVYTQPAIALTGGTLDLGTVSSPGGDTVNVNGAGALIQNTTSNPISTVGDALTLNGISVSSLSGLVWEDFNDDGQVDFGENGISGVKITLTGTDDLGHAVNLSQTTDSDGAYVFLYLRPGNYYLTETPPAGYGQGIDSVGTAGGSVSATDQFFVSLGAGVNGLNYNFGEQPPAGSGVHHGQTAGIGFWNNKNGQALIKALNGGSTSTQLANWLAATLPNTFGIHAGSNNLTGKSNADVAALFQQDFVMKGVKLDAQLLATALSVYATNATLDPTKVAASYSFTVSGDGAGTATGNVGSNGDAFGVANNTTLTLMDLLLAADAQAVNGVLYGGNAAKRNEANAVFSAVNQDGGIS